MKDYRYKSARLERFLNRLAMNKVRVTNSSGKKCALCVCDIAIGQERRDSGNKSAHDFCFRAARSK